MTINWIARWLSVSVSSRESLSIAAVRTENERLRTKTAHEIQRMNE